MEHGVANLLIYSYATFFIEGRISIYLLKSSFSIILLKMPVTTIVSKTEGTISVAENFPGCLAILGCHD